MRVFIVDDERAARGVLKIYLESYPEITVIGESGRPLEALKAINTLKPDLVFLDVQMPTLDGFEMLPYIHYNPLIVFCTAYDAYAIRAFKVNALDYLLKPFDEVTLADTLERAMGEWQKLQSLKNLGQRDEFLHKVVCQVGGNYEMVYLKDVVMLSKEGRYTRLLTNGKEHLIDFTISHMSEKIDPAVFFRVSRGTILNRSFVKKFTYLDSGNLSVILSNGEECGVSRRRAKEFKNWLVKESLAPDILTRS